MPNYKRYLKKIFIVFLLFFSINSCKTDKNLVSEYSFSDHPYRDLRICFKPNGAFIIRNNQGGDMRLMGLTHGIWFELATTSVFVNCSNDSTIEKKYYLPYEEINIDSVLERKIFFYPLIYNDTIFFSEKYKNAHLKGFDFKWINGYRYDRFIKKLQKLQLNKS